MSILDYSVPVFCHFATAWELSSLLLLFVCLFVCLFVYPRLFAPPPLFSLLARTSILGSCFLPFCNCLKPLATSHVDRCQQKEIDCIELQSNALQQSHCITFDHITLRSNEFTTTNTTKNVTYFRYNLSDFFESTVALYSRSNFSCIQRLMYVGKFASKFINERWLNSFVLIVNITWKRPHRTLSAERNRLHQTAIQCTVSVALLSRKPIHHYIALKQSVTFRFRNFSIFWMVSDTVLKIFSIKKISHSVS